MGLATYAFHKWRNQVFLKKKKTCCHPYQCPCELKLLKDRKFDRPFLEIPNPKSQFPIPIPNPNLQSPIPNPQSQSPIPNPQSPIPNPQSPIPNPQSLFTIPIPNPNPQSQFPIPILNPNS